MVLGGITSIQAVAVIVSLRESCEVGSADVDRTTRPVFSHLYSFSFEQNPYWSRLYPGQEEVLVRKVLRVPFDRIRIC